MSDEAPPAVCTYIFRHERPCHKRGERCTHPAVPSSLFCRWHQVLPDKDLRGIDFSKADEEQKHLCEAYLIDARLDGAILKDVLLHDANLHGASLTQANLQGANLSHATLIEADLWGASLQGATLWGANLRRAQLILTHLQFADLVRAHLQGTMFDSAKLDHTDLRGADLVSAHFDSTHIESVYISGKFGSAQLMLCTLKNAASLDDLVAHQERAGLRSEVAAGDQPRTYTLQDYNITTRDARDVARDHRVLKIYFKQEGRLDLSSKHYLREMRSMRHYYWNRATKTNEEKSVEPLPTGQRIRWAFRGIMSKILDIFFGYGEEPSKLLGWTFITIFLTAGALSFWYNIQGSIRLDPISNFISDFATALVSFAVAPPIPVNLIPQFWIASVTAFFGKFCLALFVFILGRKVER
ncbi:MAG: pentapeptide repeat-containing protein [Candidatus Hodarchaeota archaeon]